MSSSIEAISSGQLWRADLNMGDQVDIMRITRQGYGTIALTLQLNPDLGQVLEATINPNYKPEEPSAHALLEEWDLDASTIQFGYGAETTGLFLAPTVVEGRLFGAQQPPSIEVQHQLGIIAMGTDKRMEHNFLDIAMPKQPYAGLDTVLVGLRRAEPSL